MSKVLLDLWLHESLLREKDVEKLRCEGEDANAHEPVVEVIGFLEGAPTGPMSPWPLSTPRTWMYGNVRSPQPESGQEPPRAARLARHLPGHEFEYDRTYLAGIERGEQNYTLAKLAEQLSVDPLELLRAAD